MSKYLYSIVHIHNIYEYLHEYSNELPGQRTWHEQGSLTKIRMKVGVMSMRIEGLDPIFTKMMLDEYGRETDIPLLNEYSVATFDYYIASAISQNIQQCREFHYVFEEQVALYKALDGTAEKHNWRQELLNCLKSWEEMFPETSRSKKRLSNELTAPVRAQELQVPVCRL